MRFQLSGPLPKECNVAVSGGPDSMAVLHWLTKGAKDRIKNIIHVDHGTGEFANSARIVTRDYVKSLGLEDLFRVHYINTARPKYQSKEHFWREQRLQFFSLYQEYPTVTAHNLDDCVEEYIMNKMVRFGPGNTIKYNGPSNVARPFRCWTKMDMKLYCKENKVPYLDDPSNEDIRFTRNRIRRIIVPNLLSLNPGLFNQVRKMILKEETVTRFSSVG